MRARFFCDSCGAAVAARADKCPACGKVFAAVRCPNCGYEGRPSEFARGCKVCGYLAEEGARGQPGRRTRPTTRLSRGTALILGASLVLVLIVLVSLILGRG